MAIFNEKKGYIYILTNLKIFVIYYKQIDSFRFFAAFTVLIAHWLHFVPTISRLRLEFIGVDFFFVLSGFLISYQLFELRYKIIDGETNFGKASARFIIKRALCIFPLYYTVLILATIFNKGEIRDAFIYNVSYLSNFYFIEVQHWSNIFSHFWSLSVEEHFYLVWPIIVLFFRAKITIVLTVLIALFSLTFRYIHFTSNLDYFSVHIHTLSCLDLFMFGAILAYFLRKKKDAFLRFFNLKASKHLILSGLLAVYLVLVFQKDSPIFDWVVFRFIFGIFSAGLIGLLVVGFKGLAGRIFEHKWLVQLGKLSYAIYLTHNFIPGLLLEVKKLALPIVVEFFIYLTATLLASILLYRFIEKPIRAIGKRLS